MDFTGQFAEATRVRNEGPKYPRLDTMSDDEVLQELERAVLQYIGNGGHPADYVHIVNAVIAAPSDPAGIGYYPSVMEQYDIYASRLVDKAAKEMGVQVGIPFVELVPE